MFGSDHYIPVLKWKQGEYQALHRLSENIKKKINPLIEIPPIGYDFESGKERESIDSHLGDFGRRLKAKWQNRTCFVDLKYIAAHTRMGTGKHYIEEVFDQCRSEKCNPIPVVSLKSDSDFLDSVKEVIKKDRRGVCFRIYLEDFDRPNLRNDLEILLITLGVGISESDIVIDYENRKLEPVGVFVKTFLDLFQVIRALNRWRTFTVIGTSYPNSIAAIRPPFGTIPRSEWSFYKKLRLGIGEGRLPTFGDYAVAHPELVDLDHRLIKPFAKLRYTIDDEWHIGRGDTVRTHGFEQYRGLCSQLMRQPYFDGPSFSEGDQYIDECSKGNVPTGNLSTWVWVSINRHLTKVVSDLATLP